MSTLFKTAWLFAIAFGLILKATTVGAASDPVIIQATEANNTATVTEVRVGVLAYQGEDQAIKDFYPTIDYLKKALPQFNFKAIAMDQNNLNRAIQNQQIQFLITNPGHYLDLESSHIAIPIATLSTGEKQLSTIPTDTVGSTVISLNQAGHPKIFQDLIGKRIAIVSASAFGGWRIAWHEAKRNGVDLSLKAYIVETGYPMQTVIDALRRHQVEAGVIRSCLLEEEIAAGHISPSEFTVVSEQDAPHFPCRLSSQRFPDWPFLRIAHTSTAQAKMVAAALLNMPITFGRNWTVAQDYSDVRQLYRDLKLGPYAFSHFNISNYLHKHWQWLVVLVGFLFWWIFHVIRVESLVRRRTWELTQAIKGREDAEKIASKHKEERDQFSRLGILGEMASNIAHELNQPLSAIANYAEGITRVIDAGRPGPAFIRDGARGIAGQAERAGAIIRRIRSFVRRREVRLQELDLNKVVDSAMLLFGGQARLRSVPIKLDLEQQLPLIFADEIEIEQVILNLLQNSLDALEHSPTKGAGIIVRTSKNLETIELSVRDFGSGLTEQALTRLFEPFFTTKPQGLGLGLSICRTIIESLGGHLWASNETGGGVTIGFSLPIVEIPIAGRNEYPPIDVPRTPNYESSANDAP